MSELELEQQTNIKFLVKLGKSGNEIREMLVQVYADKPPIIFFFVFSKIKEILKGRHFDDIDDIRTNTTTSLKAIPQNQFQNCFEVRTRRWHRCIASQGEYFEGTTVVFSSEVCSTVTAMNSRNVLSHHVYIQI